jgi:hypothetical protein
MSYRTRPDIALRTESSCRNKPGVNVFATITALCLNLCMSQVQEKCVQTMLNFVESGKVSNYRDRGDFNQIHR